MNNVLALDDTIYARLRSTPLGVQPALRIYTFLSLSPKFSVPFFDVLSICMFSCPWMLFFICLEKRVALTVYIHRWLHSDSMLNPRVYGM